MAAFIFAAAFTVHAQDSPAQSSLANSARDIRGRLLLVQEPPYDKLDGVLSTTSGYIGGSVANPSYEGRTGHAEAVQVENEAGLAAPIVTEIVAAAAVDFYRVEDYDQEQSIRYSFYRSRYGCDMLTVTITGPDRLDIELSGKVDAEGMKAALDELVSKSEGITHGRMLYTVHDFNFPSLAAIAVELSRLPAMLRLIKKFDRAAVMTDTVWLQKASEIEGAIIPGLEIKAFGMKQTLEAEAWLNR